jgi:hypothetical protein
MRCSHARLEGIWPRFYRREAKPALAIGDLDSITLKIRIEGRWIGVGGMVVTTKGVGLPEFHARLPEWLTTLVENPTRHVNDLPFRA